MIHELTPWQLQLRKNSQAGFEVYCTQAIKTAYFRTGYWTSSYVVLFYAVFPQTRTENSLIQLKYKVTRKGAGSNISTVRYYLTLISFWMLQHFSLKESACTMKCCYWWITNPSKGNFSAWCDLSEATTCFALTRVITAALQLENIPGGSGSWFFPYHLALRLSPCNIKQHGVMSVRLSARQHFHGIRPCCRPLLALKSSTILLHQQRCSMACVQQRTSSGLLRQRRLQKSKLACKMFSKAFSLWLSWV